MSTRRFGSVLLALALLGGCAPERAAPREIGFAGEGVAEIPKARWWHTATPLPAGKYKNQILIVGGADASFAPVADSIVVLNPVTGDSVSLTDVGFTPRYWHAAVLVAAADEEDGFVLITGGCNATRGCQGAVPLDDVWRFSLRDGSFSLDGSLNHPRSEHTATSVGTLEKPLVFIAGGDDGGSTEVYDARNPSFGASLVGPQLLAGQRYGHTATETRDQVVLVGGAPKRADLVNEIGKSEAVRITDLRKASATAPIVAADMRFAQGAHQHTATFLRNSEKILSLGTSAGLDTAQLFDNGSWSEIPAGKRLNRQATLTLQTRNGDNDRVMFVGGWVGSQMEKGVNIFTPDEGRWSDSRVPLPEGRWGHTATVTSDNRRGVIVGGRSGGAEVLASVVVTGVVPNGEDCEDDGECLSGYCVAGGGGRTRCCDERCGGECEACARADGAAQDGACTPRTAQVVCRAAEPLSCDAPEYCTGRGADCPKDQQLPNDEPCDDHNQNTQEDHCQAGVCLGTTPFVGGDASPVRPSVADAGTEAGTDASSEPQVFASSTLTPLSCSFRRGTNADRRWLWAACWALIALGSQRRRIS